jgi:hypothetical protein
VDLQTKECGAAYFGGSGYIKKHRVYAPAGPGGAVKKIHKKCKKSEKK